MNAAILIVLPLLLPAQDPPTPEPATAAAEGGWTELDGVLLIVDEKMLTSRSFLRDLARIHRVRPFENEGEFREAERQIRTERVRRALSVQAGQNLGFDEAQIERRAKEFLRRQQEERFQGSSGMAAFLRERDRTLYEEQESVEEQLYAEIWETYVTGEGPLADIRQSRDLYVRPGYLRYAYRQSLDRPELLSRIGGGAQTVVLQQLFLDPDANGGEDESLALANDLRRRIVDGEDMGDLVERYGANKTNRGMLEPWVESRVKLLDPAAGAFLAEAEPGDVSEVISYTSRERKRPYWRILRLVERRPGVVPDLAETGVQQELVKNIQKDLSEWRQSEGLLSLAKASYIWPTELIPK